TIARGRSGLTRSPRNKAPSGAGSRAFAFVYQVFQLFAGLEERNLLGRHLDARPGLGIASDTWLALPRAKAAKAADLDLVARSQRLHDAVKDGLNDDFPVFARYFR